MIRVIVKPAKSLLKRNQWRFEIRAANGRQLHPNDTYTNRGDAVAAVMLLFGMEPVELVVQDRFGNVEERRQLR
jgi:hypothetical protein